MRCKGIVMYKNIEERAGGTFKNDKGEDITFDKAYVVKFDETVDDKINERKLKFPFSNKSLHDKFKVLKPYTYVTLTCDVVLMASSCKLTPIDVEEYSGEVDED